MITKEQFTQAIENIVGSYPTIAALYKANDPRIRQNLEAQATMLAMFSSQVETSSAEPFEKVRDATVLADAAIRGIIRKARPGTVNIKIENKSAAVFYLDSGRELLDSSGNTYQAISSITLDPGLTDYFNAIQVSSTIIQHTVSDDIPFYTIEIPGSTDGSYLSGISVSDEVGDYIYRERYVNTFAGDRVYHVESDDMQRVYVRFGYAGIVGYQPPKGLTINLTISRSVGALSLTANSPFSFSATRPLTDLGIEMNLSSVVDPGDNPPDMSTLRDIIKYPSVYDHNAVYLGEFDFLVRRAYPDAKFISVWNEAAEELARGAHIDNINTLFVAFMSDTGNEEALTEANPASPANQAPITSLTNKQIKVKATILAADDSYRVRFYRPVRSKIVMSISAVISAAYTVDEVETQIRSQILAEYGFNAPSSKHGSSKPLYQKIYSLLRTNIAALADASADMRVSITDYPGPRRPELWRYVAPDSLTVDVTVASIAQQSWGLT